MHENHAWNCRLLRGQIDQLKNAISESIRQLTQVVEGAIQYNLIQVSIVVIKFPCQLKFKPLRTPLSQTLTMKSLLELTGD